MTIRKGNYKYILKENIKYHGKVVLIEIQGKKCAQVLDLVRNFEQVIYVSHWLQE